MAITVAADYVVEELDEEFFGVRVGRTTAAELELCRGLASLGEGPRPFREVARGMEREPRSLSPTRAALIRKGLVYRAERGRIAFTVPHFGRYLERAHGCAETGPDLVGT